MKRKTYFLFLCACLCGFWLVSCTPKVPSEAEIVIISFNDLHGDFENLPQLSAFIKETKAAHYHVIVADGGDRFTGNPYNDFYHEREFPIIDLENHMDVDITVIGNHEFDYGVELLSKRIKDSKSIAIAANMETKGTVLKHIEPYHIFNKDGIKIAFLGLTNVDRHTGKPATTAENVAAIQFYDPIETAVTYRYLRNKAHVFVALTHIGVEEDLILADSMPELDLIIGAHSHTLLVEPLIQNDVLITQAERNGRYVGKTRILLKKGVVSQVINEMIDLSTWDKPVDSTLLAMIHKYESNASLRETFVTLKYDIPDLDKLGYATADAVLKLPNVDISIVNCNGIRRNHLSAGPVSFVDILRIYPFSNYLVIVDLKPADIRAFIEAEFLEKKGCLMAPAGFEYVVERTQDGTIKVVDMTLPDGKKMDEQKSYRLGVNSYLFSKYLFDFIENAEYTSTFVVDNIVDYLRQNPNMDYRNATQRAKYK